ncbi:unnamed protein product [Parnassius mnemosyne]|uniref:Uncharacterized protein n=1 Tax=Parnassius mnemosyne TaxID=213953 RepID=A0AAV1M9U3_9NEOP
MVSAHDWRNTPGILSGPVAEFTFRDLRTISTSCDVKWMSSMEFLTLGIGMEILLRSGSNEYAFSNSQANASAIFDPSTTRLPSSSRTTAGRPTLEAMQLRR